jgi:2-methylisocitrate lyase-like PEP mutase family enzyme
MTPEEKRSAFRALHQHGCFVIPNPWDIGSARYLQSLGFKALATTSAGLAFSLGISDGELTRDMVVRHLQEIVPCVDVPVSADFQDGYGASVGEMQKSVRMAMDAGVAGFSIEDMRSNGSLYEIPEAVDRLKAAREAAPGAVLTARSECFLTGHPDPLNEAVKRIKAYAETGADVLYAPGLSTQEDIREVVAAADPKPVNVLIGQNLGLSLTAIGQLGVRRVSLGSALARAAWDGFRKAASEIATTGTFEAIGRIVSFGEMNATFKAN